MDSCLNFVRKTTENNNNLKFSYPSLSFQAESLFHCWDDILQIQKKSGEDISKAIRYQRNLKFMEDKEPEIEEELSDTDREEELLDTGRFCYGNKPNLNVSLHPDPNKSIQEEQERRVFPIATDFKYEYNSL